jgi:hypothetical protein
MAIKTFNIDEKIHKDYSDYCKEHGISMSKRIENFIKEEISKIRKKNNKITINHSHSGEDADENPKISLKNDPSVAHNGNGENSFSKYCY